MLKPKQIKNCLIKIHLVGCLKIAIKKIIFLGNRLSSDQSNLEMVDSTNFFSHYGRGFYQQK